MGNCRQARSAQGGLRSILPDAVLGGLDFCGWVFEAGMEFGASAIWWGKGGHRPYPHEGLDLCLFYTKDGQQRRLAAGTPVRALLPGTVRAVTADFVARSVWLRHQEIRTGSWILHSVYAHVDPADLVRPGEMVEQGIVVASIAAPTASTGPPPHLHLSLLLVHEEVKDEACDWAMVHKEPGIKFLDPKILQEPISLNLKTAVSHEPHERTRKNQ